MSTKIKKTSSEIVKGGINPKVLPLLKEYEADHLQIGEWYLKHYDSDKTCSLIQITNIEYKKQKHHGHPYETVTIHYRVQTDDEALEFEDKTMPHTDLSYYTFEHLPEGIQQFKKTRAEALKVINGEISLDSYSDKNNAVVNEERALVGRGSKEMLQSMKDDLEQKQKHVSLVQSMVRDIMQQRTRDLEKIQDQLQLIRADFEKKIEKFQRVIISIELYLGIHEELHQIKEGATAAADEPICFRQMMLYMDEEMGIWKNGGFDWNDIDKFDEWLVKDNNFKRLAPESKCVVVFRPRRKSKHYSDNAWIQAIKDTPNLTKTYFLIRNGETLYRIFTDHISVRERLFPKKKEFQKILDELSDIQNEYGEDSHYTEEKKEKAEKVMYYYKKQAILLQGLIDRSTVFHPLSVPNISIFRLHETPDAVRFIYDDEDTLPSGRLSFWDWHREINSKITKGSRILITGNYSNWSHQDIFYRRLFRSINTYAITPPQEGIYEIELFPRKKRWDLCESQFEIAKKIWEENKRPYKVISTSEQKDNDRKKQINDSGYHYSEGYDGHAESIIPLPHPITKGEHNIEVEGILDYLTIKWNPGGQVTSWNDYKLHDRKNKMRFKVYRKDEYVLNYDQIELDDIEFYLTSRVDRENYLEMMPILEKIKKFRLKEIAQEEQFIKLVIGRNESKFENGKELDSRIRESIAWWKYKNEWKRPIEKDDTLALRMIEKRILSKNYNTFKKFDYKK